VSLFGNLHVHGAMKAKRPPNAALMKRLVQLGRGGIAIAIIAVAIAFSG
jgi:shikimate 5-dehydrogenase